MNNRHKLKPKAPPFEPLVEFKLILHNAEQPEFCKKYTRNDLKNFTKRDRRHLKLTKKEIKSALKEKAPYYELSTPADDKPRLRQLISIGNIEYYLRGL